MFALSLVEMADISREVTKHTLNIKPLLKSIKQGM
jgi:hypothetical protein